MCNLYLVIVSSPSVGQQLQGNILADADIAVGEAARIAGSWCAANGVVAFIDDVLTAKATCSS